MMPTNDSTAFRAAVGMKIQRDAQRDWVNSIIAQAQVSGFHGKLTLILKAGKIERVIKEDSLRPPQVPT